MTFFIFDLYLKNETLREFHVIKSFSPNNPKVKVVSLLELQYHSNSHKNNSTRLMSSYMENSFRILLWVTCHSQKKMAQKPYWCVTIIKFKTSTRSALMLFLIAHNLLGHQAPMTKSCTNVLTT